MPFTHLHTHSHYSLLNAIPKINELVKTAKEDGMKALALTDNNNLYGAIEFYTKCKKEGIKPIIGIDAFVAARTRKDKDGKIDSRRTRLILLAKNEIGWKNLIRLVTRAHFEGFYYKPRIDKELIQELHEGLICISPFFSGEISLALKFADISKADEMTNWYREVFGNDFYFEINHHPEIVGALDQKKKIISYAREKNIPIVASHDVYYMSPDDSLARKTLMSIQLGGGSDSAPDADEENFSFINQKTADKYFKDTPDALENNQKIVDECNLEIELGKWKFPAYKIESGLSSDDELRRLAFEGVEKRQLDLKDENIKKRLEYELEVIQKKGYATYFLVVGDLLREARSRGILTTIRGSVAGSLTTYVLGITNVNPIEYNLPFERFLNPDRPSAPDIDMDFADNRRDEIIEYVRQKYGQDKVAQIGTFGTMMARGAVRDTARALGYPYATGDQIAKLIPMGSQGFPMTIDRALEETDELKELYKNDPDTKRIIDMAKKIEGCARHISVHAAGVIISPEPLDGLVPLQFDPKGEGKIITQFDMHSVGEDNIGLLKFDFLGIRNLAILADSVRLTKKITGDIVDIEHVDVQDKKTFQMLARGETAGLFQLNGTGMTRYLKELKPTSIHDINAMVALFRPGPMESIPEYIKRKHNPSLVSYLDPRMKDILDRSYGVITYQDDVMMIAIKLAGYTWIEADKLRKAMGKKIPALMEEQKKKLIDGLVKNGMSETKANGLWLLIEPFAAYGFNKAHAASYGKVAYQTAYMKANYPAIYMASVLTAESGDIEKIAEIIDECKRMKIPILPPDVNESFEGFTVVRSEDDKDQIRFGLTTIKNFGEGIAHAIIEERKANGKFISLEDFLQRVTDKNLNKKSLESLIKSGAMDCFEDRMTMSKNIESLLEYNKSHKQSSNQDNLFSSLGEDSSKIKMEKVEMNQDSQTEILGWEKELLGIYVSGHPLKQFEHFFQDQKRTIKFVKENSKDGFPVLIAGIITNIRNLKTKNNESMAFITLTDFTGSMECVAFPRTFQNGNKELLKLDARIAIKGKFSKRNGEPSVIIDAMKALEEIGH